MSVTYTYVCRGIHIKTLWEQKLCLNCKVVFFFRSERDIGENERYNNDDDLKVRYRPGICGLDWPKLFRGDLMYTRGVKSWYSGLLSWESRTEPTHAFGTPWILTRPPPPRFSYSSTNISRHPDVSPHTVRKNMLWPMFPRYRCPGPVNRP